MLGTLEIKLTLIANHSLVVKMALPDLWLKSYERLQNAARSTAETQ